jgi:hypothetical protein
MMRSARNDGDADGGGQDAVAQDAHAQQEGAGEVTPNALLLDALRDQDRTNRLTELRRCDAELAMTREKAAMDVYERRVKADADAQVRVEASRAKERRRTLHAAGWWVFVLVVALTISGAPAAVLGKLHEHGLPLPHGTTGGGYLYTAVISLLVAFAIAAFKPLAEKFAARRQPPPASEAPDGPVRSDGDQQISE